MSAQGEGFWLFDTALGRVGVAWGERGLRAVNLPEASAHAAEQRLRARLSVGVAPGTPPAHVREVARRIHALLEGARDDLRDVALDMAGLPEFACRVYEAARAIPVGHTLSYGELARRVGTPGAARAVGQALGKNPFAPIVPCHRILSASGKLGGFSAYGGGDTKRRMLAIEGASTLTMFG